MSIQFRFSKGIFAGALSLALAVPIAAFAQGKEAKPANSGEGRYKKKETEVKATQTNLTKPEAPPPPKKETRPSLSVDAFREQKTQEIQKIVDAQISKMRRLLTVTAEDDPQKPDFFFRLGELYAEKQRHNFNNARALDQKIYELQPNQRGPLLAQQKTYEEQEKKWLLEAVKAFISATKFRKYDRMDEVLFRRVRHVVTEMERTRAGAAALRRHDYSTLGAQLDASHRSAASDYEVSCEELDVITAAARGNDGVFGSRLTGAGFGGCAIALLRPGAFGDVVAKVSEVFLQRFGVVPAFDVLRVGAGPGEID